MDITSGSDRIVRNTAQKVSDRINDELRGGLSHYREQVAEIDDRLLELDRERDVERVLETNASVLAFTGVALGVAVNRRFLWLPAIATAFLFQHAVQGWRPPLPLFRRLGYRTARQIAHERELLKRMQASTVAEKGEHQLA
jgi:hypothetical protein